MKLPDNKLIIDRPIKVALIGCGRISGKHIEAIQKYKSDLELVAICDTDEDVLNGVSSNLDVQSFSSLDNALKISGADLFVICTPSGLHPKQVIQCAYAGKHVMTEKPMATRWKDGLEMVKACDRAEIFLFVVKQNRYNSTLRLLKNTIENKRFGRINSVQINVFWTRPQEYYDSAAWRGTWEFDGGALMNQASHYVDLLDWLIGPIESVQAMIGTLSRNIEVEDTAVLNIRWRSGTLGSMAVSMLTYPKNLEGSITILGEKGTAKVGGVAVNEIEHWTFEDGQDESNLIEDANYKTASVYGHGHVAYYQNVIDSLRGKDIPATDGREGLRSLELLIASYLSARSGDLVTLPLEY